MSLLLLLHSDGSGVATPPWLPGRLYRPSRRLVRFQSPPRRIYPLGGPLLFDSATDSAGTALEGHLPENGGTSWAWQTSTAARLAIVNRATVKGLRFDGAGTVSLPNLDTSTFGIAVWVKRDNHLAAQDDVILSVGNNGWGVVFLGQTIAFTKVQVSNVATGNVWTDDNWHHLGVSYDGSDARFYVDGEKVDTQAYSVTFNSSSGAYSLGSRGSGEYGSLRLTDFRIYDDVPSDADYRTIYNHGYPNLADTTTGNTLLAWWKTDAGSGTSLADSSGNARTGTLGGTAAWGTMSSLTPSTKISQTTNNGAAVKAVIDAGLADLVTFRARVTIPAGSYAGDLIVRASPDAAAYVGYRIASAGTGVVVDGSITDATVESYLPWQEYVFKAEILGTSIRFYRDDILLFEKVTATNQANRVYGFSSTCNNTGALTFDDLELYPTPAPDWQPYVRMGRLAAERFYHRPPGPPPRRAIASLLGAIDQSIAAGVQPILLRPDPKATQSQLQHQQRTSAILNSLLLARELAMTDVGEFRLGYTPEDLAQWAPGPPSTVADALNKIAALLKTLNGGTGP